jgi:hypothetical protein
MNRNELRALYTTVRAALASGVAVDRRDIAARVYGADAAAVAAFESLLGIDVAALHAQGIADARKMDAANAALRAAALRRQAEGRKADARREAARLARETAATVMEF